MKSYLFVIILLGVLFEACESGHEIHFDPPCITYVEHTFMLPDSLLNNRQYQQTSDTIQIENANKEKFTYSVWSGTSIRNAIDCDTTLAYQWAQATYSTGDLAPKIVHSLGFFNEDTLGKPYMNLSVGSFRIYVNTETMTALNTLGSSETRNVSTYHKSLASMDTTYSNVYLFEKLDYLEDEIRGIVYSHSDGLLGFYRDETKYWKVK